MKIRDLKRILRSKAFVIKPGRMEKRFDMVFATASQTEGNIKDLKRSQRAGLMKPSDVQEWQRATKFFHLNVNGIRCRKARGDYGQRN